MKGDVPIPRASTSLPRSTSISPGPPHPLKLKLPSFPIYPCPRPLFLYLLFVDVPLIFLKHPGEIDPH